MDLGVASMPSDIFGYVVPMLTWVWGVNAIDTAASAAVVDDVATL